MKIITAQELPGRSESDLSALFHCATVVLTRSRPLSPERRVALATLENVSRARAQLAQFGPRDESGASDAPEAPDLCLVGRQELEPWTR